MKNQIIIIALSSFLLSSCSYSTYYLQTDAQKFPKSDPKAINLYTNDILDKEYDVIGSIATDVMGEGNAARDLLKSKASKLGADAVIFVRLSGFSTYGSRVGISGVMIKFK